MTNRPVVALGLLVICACSVSDGIDQPSPDDITIAPPSPVDNYVTGAFRTDYARAACAWFGRCAGTVGQLFADEASCLSIYSFVLESQFDTGRQNLNDPFLYRVDSAKAHTCVDAIGVRACTAGPPSFSEDDSCREAFVGRLADGECCDARGGCGPGLTCEYDGRAAPLIGYCSAVGEAGESCFVQECVEGTSCQNTGDGRTCLVPLGLESGAPCNNTFDCGPGLACLYSSAAQRNLCLLRPEVGEFCYLPESPCAAGLACINVDQGPFTCSATRGVEGNGCFRDEDCADGMVCDSAVCVRPGVLGEACDDSDPLLVCQSSLACVNGFCAEMPVPVAIGDACLPDGPECPGAFGEGECRLTASGYRCSVPAQENEPCGDDLPDCDISRSLICDAASSTCKKLPALGAPCELLCADFFENACVGGVCAKRFALDAPCTPQGDEDPKELFATACAVFSSCVLDAASGEHRCKRPEAVIGSGACQP